MTATWTNLQKLTEGKRKSVLFVLLLAAIVGFPLLLSQSRVTEPVYQGKRYSEWIEQTTILGSGSTVELMQQKGVAAIKAMGTNAIPYLLQEISSKDSLLKQIFIKRTPKQAWKRFGIVPAPWRQHRAEIGFRILRNHKESFIYSLRELEKDPELAPTIRPLLESLERGW